MTLTPAYGRDYKSAKAVKADFADNRDFIVADIVSPWCGKPANKTDLQKAGEETVLIRYCKLARIVSVKV